MFLNHIIFYRKENGEEPVYDFMRKLAQETSKDNRINLNKIQDYIQILQEYGTSAGEPYMKNLEGEIWELRPVRNRVLFAACSGNTYVLLHCFLKKTRKTPRREIERAKKEYEDYLSRRVENG